MIHDGQYLMSPFIRFCHAHGKKCNGTVVQYNCVYRSLCSAVAVMTADDVRTTLILATIINLPLIDDHNTY